MSTLDLRKAIETADHALDLLESLDSIELDERPEARDQPIIGLSKAQSREQRLRNSRDLQQAAHELALAAELVRAEWWKARTDGE